MVQAKNSPLFQSSNNYQVSSNQEFILLTSDWSLIQAEYKIDKSTNQKSLIGKLPNQNHLFGRNGGIVQFIMVERRYFK